MVLAFDTREHLDAWLASPPSGGASWPGMEQHSEGERTVNIVGGFAGWFAPGGGSSEVPALEVGGRRPAGVRCPVSLLVPRRARLVAVPRPATRSLATVIGNVIGIVVLTWLLMPRITRWLDAWLRRR